MLFAFLGPLFNALAALNGAWHLLLIVAPPLAFFTLGYAWRHWGNGWLWFAVPAAKSATPWSDALKVGPPALTAGDVHRIVSQHLDDMDSNHAEKPKGTAPPSAAESDAVEHVAVAVEAAQKQVATADANAKAMAAKAEAQRAKLAAAAGQLAKPA